MRLLITGAGGFAGTWLCRAAVAAGHEVWGLTRRPWIDAPDGVQAVQGDVCKSQSLEAALDLSRAEAVFHLAAFSEPAASWKDPLAVFETNLFGLIRLLEEIARREHRPRVVVASSGYAYGLSGEACELLCEDAPFRPVSPYGSSKAAADLVAGQYAIDHDLDIVRLRLFNHTGPGRPSRYVLSSFAKQIVEIERSGASGVLEVGRLDGWRDFSDVRDIAAAWLASLGGTERGAAYNVCSGQPRQLAQLLDRMLEISGVEAEIRRLPALDRPSEISRLCGDPSRFQAATGWRPAIDLDQTLRDLIDWWRQRPIETES